MKLIVAGSRGLRPTFDDIDAALAVFRERFARTDDVIEVVSGEAEGPDRIGAEWALRKSIPIHRDPVTAADIKLHGKYLGPKMRNRRMAERGDAAIVFWDGKSGGSSDMVCRMVARQKDVLVVPQRPPARPARRT